MNIHEDVCVFVCTMSFSLALSFNILCLHSIVNAAQYNINIYKKYIYNYNSYKNFYSYYYGVRVA